MKPLLPSININKCDNCHIELSKRKDDTEDIIKNRLNIYRESTEPIIKCFKEKNIPIVDFIPYKGVDDYDKLENLIFRVD